MKESLIDIQDILAEDGIVFVEIPNALKYGECYEKSTPFSFFTYEHVIHMGIEDLQNICNLYGFSIIESGYHYKEVSNYPCIWAILKKCDPNKVLKKSETSKYIIEYKNKCCEKLQTQLKRFSDNNTELILWGIGASTASSLESFLNCNVIQLVDGNPYRQNIKYKIGEREFTIQAPEKIENKDAVIFIMSGPYKNAISNQINKMGLSNKIYSFDSE